VLSQKSPEVLWTSGLVKPWVLPERSAYRYAIPQSAQQVRGKRQATIADAQHAKGGVGEASGLVLKATGKHDLRLSLGNSQRVTALLVSPYNGGGSGVKQLQRNIYKWHLRWH